MNRNIYDDYEKLKIVGKGAFGTATLYRRKIDGKHVVMKEIFIMDMDLNEKKTALNEVEVLSTLNHPNIIRYLGSFQIEGSLVIIMEYADGGNLAQLINIKKNRNEKFNEKGILNIIWQISSALDYMHSKKILHRDLKTPNIFLNHNGFIKIGDFGISKMLNTRTQAQTVVGTPYYLSPEICEGFDYNEKSDIWALGCILYELAALKKPFEAPTLPVLVQKITACEYLDIPISYSKDLSQLVRCIIQKDPTKRPTSKFIHSIAIPNILKVLQPNSASSFSFSSFFKKSEEERSIMYEIYDFGEDQQVIPIDLPHKKILNFDVSCTHQLVISNDYSVYGWGENNYGQLGIGSMCSFKKYSTSVDILKEKNIIKCAAGKSFSIFLDSNGKLFSCGNGSSGSLGHGDWKMLVVPTLINTIKIFIKIAAGDDHVVALTTDGKVFTWGSSNYGQLGQGHRQERCRPLAISIPQEQKIKDIFCGSDSTFLITFNGEVMVAGNNNSNKLGVFDQEQVTLFQKLKLKHKIIRVAVGKDHTLLLTDNGKLIGMGGNFNGQLGQNCGKIFYPHVIDLGFKVTAISCGVNFSVVADDQNVIWLWGTFSKCNRSTNIKASNNSILCNDQAELIKQPQSILALYSSKENIKNGNLINLSQIKAKGNSVFITVHTTAPPPIKQFNETDFEASDFAWNNTSTPKIV